MKGYQIDPLMATCIVLRRMATAYIWCDLNNFLGKHGFRLSDIFCESLQKLMDTGGGLVTSPIPGAFFAQHAPRYALAAYEKNGCMDNTAAFIDGTVIGVARPGGLYVMRLVL